MNQTAVAPPPPANRPLFQNGHKPHTRSMLRDSINVEEVVYKLILCPKTKPETVASLVRSFCQLIPVIRALQGKTLVLSATLAVDRDPAHVMKRLKQLQKRKGLIDISGSPFAQFSESPPIDAIETPKPEKKTTTSE